jgi:biopolymer transport protein ExbB
MVDYGVIALLAALSVIVTAVALERLSFYRRFDGAQYRDEGALELALSRHLAWISSTASNAPYLGLLGTVLGIMLTFYRMGQSSTIDTGEIMTGLALALKATAVGIGVALAAVTLYNILLRRAKVLTIQWEIRQRERGTGEAGKDAENGSAPPPPPEGDAP